VVSNRDGLHNKVLLDEATLGVWSTMAIASSGDEEERLESAQAPVCFGHGRLHRPAVQLST
jgi:hypothetical protein